MNALPYQEMIQFAIEKAQKGSDEAAIYHSLDVLYGLPGIDKSIFKAAAAHAVNSLQPAETAAQTVTPAKNHTEQETVAVAPKPAGNPTGSDAAVTVAELASETSSRFLTIADSAISRNEKRLLPIAVGGKNPLVKWAANEANIAAGVDTRIDAFSTEQWDAVVDSWVIEIAAKFPNANACVVAKPDEFLFIDEDFSREFRAAYEAWSGEKFPNTYATSARDNHLQSHWLQTDATRKMGNVVQGVTIGKWISVRQRNEYVLAEGSQHKNGVDIYKSVGGPEILVFPDKLVEFIQLTRTDRNQSTNDFSKKPEGWLDEPFIHKNINNQVASFIGHYISGKNIKDPDELFLLIEARIEKNGCFHEDGVTPYSWNRDQVRKMCQDKVKVWKTGEEKFGYSVALSGTEGKVPVLVDPTPPSPAAVSAPEDEEIPPFDPSVMNGIYKKFVDVATHGTTLAPQFVFSVTKTIVGARMAGKVKFEDLDVEPRFYTALIGETGSGKGEAWRRVFQILNCSSQIGSVSGLKIINSADSGAGIRDVFFDVPEAAPVLMYIDEVESFGNKSAATRNPAIMDMLIELADSTSISRTKAGKQGDKFSGSKTKNDARLCVVMCGQEGPVYMKAFAGRTKLGLWDRLYPEYGVPVEAGNLPPIPTGVAFELASELNKLDYSGTMTKSADAKARLESFWAGQPTTVRKKARWKKNLTLDAFMSAFGRGSKVVESEDVEIAIKIFTRQLVIRQVHFTSEVPDRTGYYLGLIKKITETMRRQLKAGMPPEQVALSRRDYERQTNAARDNEEHLFSKAWETHYRVHLTPVKIQKANGHIYDKFVPIPEED